MKKQTKVISVQLDADIYQQLKNICDQNEQPVQGLIRFLIKKYLVSLAENK